MVAIVSVTAVAVVVAGGGVPLAGTTCVVVDPAKVTVAPFTQPRSSSTCSVAGAIAPAGSPAPEAVIVTFGGFTPACVPSYVPPIASVGPVTVVVASVVTCCGSFTDNVSGAAYGSPPRIAAPLASEATTKIWNGALKPTGTTAVATLSAMRATIPSSVNVAVVVCPALTVALTEPDASNEPFASKSEYAFAVKTSLPAGPLTVTVHASTAFAAGAQFGEVGRKFTIAGVCVPDGAAPFTEARTIATDAVAGEIFFRRPPVAVGTDALRRKGKREAYVAERAWRGAARSGRDRSEPRGGAAAAASRDERARGKTE